MGTNQYHEPADELSAETRTFARMCASLSEEAEAIGWYVQRMSVEPDPEARAIMEDSLGRSSSTSAWNSSSCCDAHRSGEKPPRASCSRAAILCNAVKPLKRLRAETSPAPPPVATTRALSAKLRRRRQPGPGRQLAEPLAQ